LVERRNALIHSLGFAGQNEQMEAHIGAPPEASNSRNLEFSENVALPDVFEHHLPAKDEYFRAHVVWPGAIVSASAGRRSVARGGTTPPNITSPTRGEART
jgi:hypothetical protein